MSGNKWWSTKVGAKLLSDLVKFSILSYDIPLDFHELILAVPLKYLMHFLSGTNTKQLWNIPEEKHFASFRILNLLIKSFVNPFVDIALTCFDTSFNAFLFEVTFLFKFFSLSPKSVFFTKLTISFLLAKFVCANLGAKCSDVNLLNSGVVIYLS